MSGSIFRIEQFTQLPIEELIKPVNGYTVLVDAWWIVYNGNVLFFGSKVYHFPQMNLNKLVVEGMLGKYPEGCTMQQLPLAFIPQRNSYDY